MRSPSLAPSLEVEYFGHAAFRFTTRRGSRLLIDPFGDPFEHRPAPSFGTPAGRPWFRRQFPRVEADLVLVTHPHFDHDAVHRVPGHPTVVRRPWQVSGIDFVVKGYLGEHAGPYGSEFGKHNVIYVIEAEGLRICHVGDNQASLPEAVLALKGDIDILMVPVDDGCHLLTFEEVDRLIDSLSPRVVVPIHYYVDSTTHPASTLGPIDIWLNTAGTVQRWQAAAHQLGAETLPDSREVWVFEPSIEAYPTIE